MRDCHHPAPVLATVNHNSSPPTRSGILLRSSPASPTPPSPRARIPTIPPRLPPLHVRTPPPPHPPQALADPSIAISAFTLSLHPPLPLLALIEHGANQRSILRSLPYGDQSLALRRETFRALGGFPPNPLLEDLDLVRQAYRRGGRVVTLKHKVRSSARRWQKFGVLGNTMRNQCVLLGHAVGVPVHRLARWYYGRSGSKAY